MGIKLSPAEMRSEDRIVKLSDSIWLHCKTVRFWDSKTGTEAWLCGVCRKRPEASVEWMLKTRTCSSGSTAECEAHIVSEPICGACSKKPMQVFEAIAFAKRSRNEKPDLECRGLKKPGPDVPDDEPDNDPADYEVEENSDSDNPEVPGDHGLHGTQP